MGEFLGEAGRGCCWSSASCSGCIVAAAASNSGIALHADSAEEAGQEAFLAGGVDEPPAGECRGVEGAETACADGQGEDEGAGGAEDDGAEMDGDGVAAGFGVAARDG